VAAVSWEEKECHAMLCSESFEIDNIRSITASFLSRTDLAKAISLCLFIQGMILGQKLWIDILA
jgi:hypothetical protein